MFFVFFFFFYKGAEETIEGKAGSESFWALPINEDNTPNKTNNKEKRTMCALFNGTRRRRFEREPWKRGREKNKEEKEEEKKISITKK